MGYLILSILFNALLSLVMRMAQPKVGSRTGLLAVNYMFCTLMAAMFSGIGQISASAEGLPFAIGLGLVNGFLYLSGFLLLQWNIRKNGVVMASAFMKLGVLVPTLLSVALFGEVPSTAQAWGFLLAISAIVLINFEKGPARVVSGIGLVLMLLIGGLGDGMSKVYEHYGASNLKNLFLFFTFASAFVLCLGIILCKRERIGVKELAFGAALGIPNYLSALFLLRSLSSMPATIVFPTFSVAVILVVSLAGILLFHEKLGRHQLIGGMLICAALALLNM